MNGDFHGLPTEILESGSLRLEYLAQAGPRLVRLFFAGQADNLLAEVHDRGRQTPYGEYRVRGGHRLWHAPEALPRTYLPDNEGLICETIPGGVRLSGTLEAPTQLRKVLQVTLDAGRNSLTLVHEIHNLGLWPVELAPWALTMMALGGMAVFPQNTTPLDASGLLPNRQLVIWPYASWQDARLRLEDDLIFIQAQPQLPPLKIGYMNHQGWIAYCVHQVLFVKRFTPQPALPHVDFGCNVESYLNDLFIEMETVGPLARVEPGQAVQHTETWELYDAPGGGDGSLPAAMQAARQALQNAGVL